MITFKKFWFYARYIVVVLPFIVIFWQEKPHTFIQSLKEQQWWVFIYVLLSPIIATLVQVLRWWLLIRTQTTHVSYMTAFRTHCSGVYYGTLFPSSFGQEIIRSYLLSKVYDPSFVWASSWIAKLLSLLSWIFIACSGYLLFESKQVTQETIVYARIVILSTCVVIAIIAFLSFSKRITSRLRPFITSFLPKKFVATAEQIRQSIYLFKQRIGILITVFVLTTALQLFLIFSVAIVAYCVSGHYHFIVFALFLSLIELAIVGLPLTPNGMGIRESLMMMVFHFVGMNTNHIAQYMALSLVGIIFGIGFAFIFSFSFTARNTYDGQPSKKTTE